MTKFELVIKTPKGEVYWTERFESKADLNKWLTLLPSQPYWTKDFTTEIIDNSAEVEKAEQEAKAKVEAERARQLEIREDLRKLRDTPPKTVAELAQAFDKVLTFFGIEKSESRSKVK